VTRLRVFLADDHPVLRSGLRGLINAQPDMEVVGEACDGAAAVRAVQELRPDVVVRDVSMPGSAGPKPPSASGTVAAGATYIDPAVAGQLVVARPRATGSASPGADLSEREAEVLQLIAQGYPIKQIASRLDVSVRTVETYRARGMEKLRIRTRAELVRYAHQRGWLSRA
jgi:DNA-binding NarL/FixJ family response regulator